MPDWADKMAAKHFWNLMDNHHIARALRAAFRRGAKEEREACEDLVRAGCIHNFGHPVPCPNCWGVIQKMQARSKL